MGVLTVKQAAERLQVAPATIYGLCARLQLPHLRIGTGRGTIRLLEEDLLAFLRGRKVEGRRPAAPAGARPAKPSHKRRS
jgi:excisionase family DNA binding protein